MYCPTCGASNDDNGWKCVSCGNVLRQIAPTTPYAPPTSGKAIGSLISSLIGFFVCPFVGQIIGLVLGYQAIREIRSSSGTIGGEGLAKAGIIISWIGLGIAVLIIALYLLIFIGAIMAGIAAETM